MGDTGEGAGEKQHMWHYLSGHWTLTSVLEDDGREGKRSSTLPMSFRRVSPTFWAEERTRKPLALALTEDFLTELHPQPFFVSFETESCEIIKSSQQG